MTAESDRLKELINDPDLKRAFEWVRQGYKDRIDDPTLSDEQVLKVRDLLHVVNQVESDLMSAIEAGEFKDYQAELEERDREERNSWPKTIQ